jgi:serine/threonine protein kinase/Tol biopolymer transport system component
MSSKRQNQIETVFAAARERPPTERAAFLAEVCAGDQDLRREVESLLAFDSNRGTLRVPALDLIARAIASDGHKPLTGATIGVFEVHELIGKGGMGEVYRARDTNLNRDVAIKVLPESVVQDAERIARFKREAQVLASLNHANIAAIHEFKKIGESNYLVMELVAGETLADRLKSGPLPLNETLGIAREIAEALEVAHEKGIVHRDLKPANVKLTPAGRVKVLDFGLAKLQDSGAGTADPSNSPTISALHTEKGVILGTAAYMSPEQARGKEVDKRSDIWSFGCILYVMLTGRQTFPNGETVTDTLAGILEREPDWQALPSATPAKIRSLLERCLRKDPRQRLRDAGDAALEIEEVRNEPQRILTPSTTPGASRWRDYVFVAVTILALFMLGVLALRGLRPAAPTAPTVRFEVFPSDGWMLSVTGQPPWGTLLHALSPNGDRLAYVATSESKQLLHVHTIASSTAVALAGTEGAVRPFWSPRGDYIGFFAQGQIKKVPASGGAVQIVGSVEGTNATWGSRDVILIGQMLAGGGVLRMPASGGEPTPATYLDPSLKESGHALPHFLPDGIHFTYLACRDRCMDPDPQTYIGELDSNKKVLLNGVRSEAFYSAGHIVFVRDGAVMAQPFDLERLELTGEAFPLGEQVSGNNVTVALSASEVDGVAYRPTNPPTRSQLVWFDHSGKQTPAAPVAEYGNVSLSPDDRYIAFDRGDPPSIWLRELETERQSKLSINPVEEAMQSWWPDSGSILFRTTNRLYRRDLGAGSKDEFLREGVGGGSVSPDGRYLVSFDANDLWVKPLIGEGKPFPLMETPSSSEYGWVSPDSRYIAIMSNQSDRWEIYITSFPKAGRLRQVSTAGGIAAVWRPDGKELYYIAPDGTLMSVSIRETATGLDIGKPQDLFRPGILGGGTLLAGRGPQYRVTRDGRFLVNVAAEGPTSTPITVILNWSARLKK